MNQGFRWGSKEEYVRHVLGSEGIVDFCRGEIIIRPEDGIEVSLSPNDPQTVFYDVLSQCERAGVEFIRLLVLKCRQPGLTTGVAAVNVREMIRRPGTVGLVAANLGSTVVHVVSIYRRMLENLCIFKDAGIVITEPDNTTEIGLSNGSSLVGITAGNVKAAHGHSYSWVHATETAHWDDPEESAIGIQPAARKAKLFVEESMANGRGGYFYDRWCSGVDLGDYLKATPTARKGLHARVFLPWYAMATYRHPTPLEWQGKPAGSLRASGLISGEEAERMTAFGLDYGQLLWWRDYLAEQCGGRIKMMSEVMPETPEQAFVSGGDSVFSAESIARLERGCKEPIRVEDDGMTRIFADPIPGRRYAVGIDSSEGIPGGNHDDSVIQIGLIPDHPGEGAIQVAEVIGRINPTRTGDIACRLGHMYRSVSGHPVWFWIEKNGPGGGVYARCWELGWRHLYGDPGKSGVAMTDVLRDRLMEYGREYAETIEGCIVSRRLVNVLASLIYAVKSDRIDHPAGGHDDPWAAWVMLLEAIRKAGFARAPQVLHKMTRMAGVGSNPLGLKRWEDVL